MMKALLVRAGIDSELGHWNAPVYADGRFVYVPVPEDDPGTLFKPGLERTFSEVLPHLQCYCRDHNCQLSDDLQFPQELLDQPMHLDPDFDFLTYGNKATNARGDKIGNVGRDDLLVFYAGFRQFYPRQEELVYALIGMYFVDEVACAGDVARNRCSENVHLRRMTIESSDFMVFAMPKISGRFKWCVPIGEWRNNAYRVRLDLLDAWGGLSVKDGWIQRGGNPPLFKDPDKFLDWIQRQEIQLVQRNN
jgi:hypothetical protein